MNRSEDAFVIQGRELWTKNLNRDFLAFINNFERKRWTKKKRRDASNVSLLERERFVVFYILFLFFLFPLFCYCCCCVVYLVRLFLVVDGYFFADAGVLQLLMPAAATVIGLCRSPFIRRFFHSASKILSFYFF